MVNFTVDDIRNLMDEPKLIRNMSVIAHVDHGKSTLSDSLIAHAGIIAVAKAGDARFMDTREDEQDRTITIKSTAVSLHFAKPITDENNERLPQIEKDGKMITQCEDYLINLIDSPGHVDFSSEVTAALRVTDGALVVVDCVEGVCVQTETVLRQAIGELIRPVLWVNKLDRVFLEMHMEIEDAYQAFSRAIESVNVVIATYHDEMLGDCTVYPNKGTVGFGSGLHGWGFTCNRFSSMYYKKFGLSHKEMENMLWGENFFNPAKKKWTTNRYNKDGKEMQRGFTTFILKPISTLLESLMAEKKDVYMPMLEKLNVKIPKDAVDLMGKPLLKRVFQTWLPAAESLLDMICTHLPSPSVAQAYRAETLYSGPLDDESAQAIRKCDPSGPLMLYISKMVPTSEKGRFYAFGRVFAGTVTTGATVRILGPDYEVGKKKDLYVKKVQRVVLMMGRYIEQLNDCPCGNIVGLVGIDSYLLKCGTICTLEDAHPFVTLKFSVSPVVRVSVDVANASDLPKLMEGLKRLAKSDPLVLCTTAPTGEHIVAGAGELHLEICIKDLREDFMKGAPIKIGQPVVSFMETITEESSQTCCGKSPNKHNRLYVTAEPLDDKFITAIEEGDVGPGQDMKTRARNMADNYGWDVEDARKLWTFGLAPEGQLNVLVDQTKAVQYLQEIKDSVCTGFQQVSMEGVICGEVMRGCRFNLMDVVMHADAIHRGAGQIMPPMRRVMYACQLASGPKMLEPMYLCDITVPMAAVAGVYSTLNARRGVVEGKVDRPGTPLSQIKAFLPVLESFGFTQLLRQNTSGQAFPQMIFSHWALMNGDPLDEDSSVYAACQEVKKRKGLKLDAPVFSNYHDKV